MNRSSRRPAPARGRVQRGPLRGRGDGGGGTAGRGRLLALLAGQSGTTDAGLVERSHFRALRQLLYFSLFKRDCCSRVLSDDDFRVVVVANVACWKSRRHG